MTPNSEKPDMPSPQEMKRALNLLLEEICATTEKLLVYAEQGDWQGFAACLNQRQQCLEQLAAYVPKKADQIVSRPGALKALPQVTKKKVVSELQKVSKVDQDVFDIISKKKTEVLANIANGNKGLEFLKSRRRDLNQEKLFSKLY